METTRVFGALWPSSFSNHAHSPLHRGADTLGVERAGDPGFSFA
jgi:hypothetical protein